MTCTSSIIADHSEYATQYTTSYRAVGALSVRRTYGCASLRQGTAARGCVVSTHSNPVQTISPVTKSRESDSSTCDAAHQTPELLWRVSPARSTRDGLHEQHCEKTVSFLSFLPMFVLSLSWENDHFEYKKWGKRPVSYLRGHHRPSRVLCMERVQDLQKRRSFVSLLYFVPSLSWQTFDCESKLAHKRRFHTSARTWLKPATSVYFGLSELLVPLHELPSVGRVSS